MTHEITGRHVQVDLVVESHEEPMGPKSGCIAHCLRATRKTPVDDRIVVQAPFAAATWLAFGEHVAVGTAETKIVHRHDERDRPLMGDEMNRRSKRRVRIVQMDHIRTETCLLYTSDAADDLLCVD